MLCDTPRWARRAKLADGLTEKLPGVVAATIEVYNTIRAELLPTPAKSHYLYNMRDLSKLFQVCTKPRNGTSNFTKGQG